MTKTEEFLPPLPGSWTLAPQGFALVNEEAVHAVVALMLAGGVREVRIDHPDVGVGGWAVVHPGATGDEGVTRDGWRSHLVATLAGGLVVGREIPWPPNAAGDGDEALCARLITLMGGCTKREWDDTVSFARGLLELPFTRRAMRALTGALLERGALSGDEVRGVVYGASRDGARRETTGVSSTSESHTRLQPRSGSLAGGP